MASSKRKRYWLGPRAVALVALGLSLGTITSAVASDAQAVLAVPARPSIDRGAFAHYGHLAFISEGALWVLDGASGRLTLLATSNQQPSDGQFSPDGRWLIYSVGSGKVWLARSDGSSPRAVARAGRDGWLPNGELLAGRAVWQVSGSGSLTRVGELPNDLVAWSPGWDRFAFESDSLVISHTKPSTGTDRLQVSSSLTGTRTTWYESKVSFANFSGAQGNFLDRIVVLPNKQGLLFTLDPDLSSSLAADGLGLYEVRAPGGPATNLGVTVGDTVTVGADGAFAFTNGPDRYAWLTKSVVACSSATAKVGDSTPDCSPIRSLHGELSFDPALSPNGHVLAFVEAPSNSATNFFQATVQRWYASHSLWVLRAASSSPVEVKDANGASAPVWSADGKSLMYVADDALWLLPSVSSRPVRIASPLFQRNDWPSYFGQVDWSGQFTWSSPS
ncbi:MAG TPA: hypothetical protein VMS00_03445 [Acidimicrobiales bacterium]|nr:hypothetical protein [Acidimicrobiales bacterium]